MFPNKAICKGKGFNCGGCDKKYSCDQFAEPSIDIDKVPILDFETEIKMKNTVSFCMRCFGNSAVPVEANFCHNCGSQGTCVAMESDEADYLRENIRYAINDSVKEVTGDLLDFLVKQREEIIEGSVGCRGFKLNRIQLNEIIFGLKVADSFDNVLDEELEIK